MSELNKAKAICWYCKSVNIIDINNTKQECSCGKWFCFGGAKEGGEYFTSPCTQDDYKLRDRMASRSTITNFFNKKDA